MAHILHGGGIEGAQVQGGQGEAIVEHRIHILHSIGVEIAVKGDLGHIRISCKQVPAGGTGTDTALAGDGEPVHTVFRLHPGHDRTVTGFGHIPGILRCSGQGIQEGHGTDLFPQIAGAENREFAFRDGVKAIAVYGNLVTAQNVGIPGIRSGELDENDQDHQGDRGEQAQEHFPYVSALFHFLLHMGRMPGGDGRRVFGWLHWDPSFRLILEQL